MGLSLRRRSAERGPETGPKSRRTGPGCPCRGRRPARRRRRRRPAEPKHVRPGGVRRRVGPAGGEPAVRGDPRQNGGIEPDGFGGELSGPFGGPGAGHLRLTARPHRRRAPRGGGRVGKPAHVRSPGKGGVAVSAAAQGIAGTDSRRAARSGEKEPRPHPAPPPAAPFGPNIWKFSERGGALSRFQDPDPQAGAHFRSGTSLSFPPI